MKRFKFAVFLIGLILSTQSIFSRPLSIANNATVTASSELKKGFACENIIDGIMAVEGKGSWMAKGNNAWIQLNWEEPQLVNKVVIYNFPSYDGMIFCGQLIFSDGSSIDVDLPKDGTAKAVEFEEKSTRSIRFIAHEGNGRNLGLSEIEVFPSPNQYKESVEWVDPYIETNHGRWFHFTTGSRPFGVVSAAPMTKNQNGGGGGYAYSDQNILGFAQIHAWTLSGINMMPTLSKIDPTKGEQLWKSPFKHDDEIVQPGYHRVYLSKSNTWVEQTSTDRVSLYRFTWTKNTSAQILFNISGKLGNSRMTNAELKKISDTEFEGSFSSIDRAYGVGPKDIKIYFVVQLDMPWHSFDGWEGKNRLKNVVSIQGENSGASMNYNVEAGDQVQMKIAVSYTSIKNARGNLYAECSTWDFEQVRMESRNIWNEWLGKIEVEGGSVAQRIKFYTDLWHVLLGRHRVNDVSGDYPDRTGGTTTSTGSLTDGFITDVNADVKNPGRDKEGKVLHNMYNSDAFWLSQWNLNILWGLAWPEVQDDIAASLVAYSNNGGLLPRGPSGGGYSYIMTGCPATSLIVSAYMKDILTKADPENAFNQIKKNHLPGGMLGAGKFGANDLKFYIEKGWWPNNAGITIEASFQDWGAAQMAKKLNKMDDYNYFMKRSHSWKNCFDPNTMFLIGKNYKGEFVTGDPADCNGYVEANAKKATWGVSHDIPGLAQLMGGNNEFCNKLGDIFHRSRMENYPYTHCWGNFSFANQPECSNAHVFSYADSPWLTQYWVREINESVYGGITPEKGYGGHDEDQGQMGGVSALMSIGLFNIIGTESINPFYEITAPVFDKVTIKLDNKYYKGKEFVIKTYNNSKENKYIQKARLNGQTLDNFWFPHEQFAAGGELELWLGDKPNKKWGLSEYPPVNYN